MRRPDRETSVFSTSAIDLFAAALGAFILLFMLLFPYYRNAAPDDAYSKTLELVEKRRLSMGELESTRAQSTAMQSELERLNTANQTLEQQLAALNPQFVTFRATVMDRATPSQHLASSCTLQPRATLFCCCRY